MTLSVLIAIVVGISEPCSTNGSIDRAVYVEAVRSAGDTPVIVCRAAPEALDMAVARLDLLVMTGGEDFDPALYGAAPSPRLGRVNAARDEYDLALLRAAVRHEVPVVGICRGHQALNVFFGGTLYQDIPSECPSSSAERHSCRQFGKKSGDHMHDVVVERGSRLFDVLGAERIEVNSSHHQAVKALAPGFRIVARSPGGVVEAIECGWFPAAGVQFHPEALSVHNGELPWKRFFKSLREFAGRRPDVPARERPIGVFDSGIGGFSVLERILTLDRFDNETGEERPDGRADFEDERFVYFGDQANMPYGRYDAAGKADFLRELAVRDAQFVLGGEGHDPAKAVVVACNTATAYGLGRIKAMARPGDADVTGVVTAGAAGALDAAKGFAGPYAIGVMATPATIASGVYERALRAGLAERGAASVEIACRGGYGLAEAVENADPGMRECARTNIVALVEEYGARGGKAPIRVIVLGCTHYPFVVDVFRDALSEMRKRPEFAALIAQDVVFVDPAVNTAMECWRSLRRRGLLAAKGGASRGRHVEAFISVGANGPLSDAVKYGRETGCADIGTRIEPMTAYNMPKGGAELLRAMMPASAAAVLDVPKP